MKRIIDKENSQPHQGGIWDCFFPFIDFLADYAVYQQEGAGAVQICRSYQ